MQREVVGKSEQIIPVHSTTPVMVSLRGFGMITD